MGSPNETKDLIIVQDFICIRRSTQKAFYRHMAKTKPHTHGWMPSHIYISGFCETMRCNQWRHRRAFSIFTPAGDKLSHEDSN